MPIGPLVPGSPTTVTPDASPSYYTSVQGPAPDGLVVADDILAAQLQALNIQKVIKTFLDGIFPDATHANMSGREVTTGPATLGGSSGQKIELVGYLSPRTAGQTLVKVVQQTLTGDLTVVRTDWDVLIVTGMSGSNWNIDFAATSMSDGVTKTVRHGGTSQIITLRNPGPVDICTLNPGEFATVIWSNPGYFHRIG